MANIKYKDSNGTWQDLIIGTGTGSGSTTITVDQIVTANSENPASSKAVITYVGDQITDKFDTIGSAAEALADAKDYADGLAGNYDAVGSAATALADAKTYVDGKVDGKFDTIGSAEAAEIAANAYTDEQLANYPTTEQMNDAINRDIITAKEFNTKPIDSNSGKTKISTNDIVVYNSIDGSGSEGVYSPVLKISGENLTETPIERTPLSIIDSNLSDLYNNKTYLSDNMILTNQGGNFITSASTFTTDEEWPSWFISNIDSPSCIVNFRYDEEQGSKPLGETLRYNFSVVISNKGINPSDLLNPLTGEFSNLSETVIPFETDVTSADIQLTGKYLFYDHSTNNFSEFNGTVGQKLKPGELYNIYFVLDFTPNIINGGDVNSETHLEEINIWSSVEFTISGMTSGYKELVYNLNHCVISPKGFKYYVNENKYIELTKDGDFKIKNGISQIVLSENALYLNCTTDKRLCKVEAKTDNAIVYLTLNPNDYIDE